MGIPEDKILFLSHSRVYNEASDFKVDSASGKVAGIINITDYMARALAVLNNDCRSQDELYEAMRSRMVYTGSRDYKASFTKCLEANHRILTCQNNGRPMRRTVFTRNPLLNDVVTLGLQQGMDVGEQASSLLLIGLRHESDVCSPELSHLIVTAFSGLARAMELCKESVGKDNRFNFNKLYKWMNIFTIQGKPELASDNLLLPYAVDYLVWKGYAGHLVILNDALVQARQADIDLMYNIAASLCLGSTTYREPEQVSSIENYKFSVISDAMNDCLTYFKGRVGTETVERVMTSTYYLAEVLCADMAGYEKSLHLDNFTGTVLDYIMMHTEFR